MAIATRQEMQDKTYWKSQPTLTIGDYFRRRGRVDQNAYKVSCLINIQNPSACETRYDVHDPDSTTPPVSVALHSDNTTRLEDVLSFCQKERIQLVMGLELRRGETVGRIRYVSIEDPSFIIQEIVPEKPMKFI